MGTNAVKTRLHVSEIQGMEIEFTGVCNLRCPLCTRNYHHASHIIKKNVRPLSEIKKQMDIFTGLKTFFLAGVVSEPTLYPEFFELIEYLQSRNIKVQLYSNGSVHDTDWWYKLGTIMNKENTCCFTVCGSTQELHAKYRIGSSLDKILQNAEAFRQGSGDKKNDLIQHILFEYNKEDFVSDRMQDIISQFSSTRHCESEGVRSINDYIVPFNRDEIRPVKQRDDIIKALFKNKYTSGEILCHANMHRKVFIDQYGRIYSCYSLAEYDEYNILEIDDDGFFDYTDILSHSYDECFKCDRKTKYFIDKLDLDFLC